MTEIRAFIAIELPEEMKQGLARLTAQLKASQLAGVKWVGLDSIHLTLKFLGNIAEDRIDDINEAMAVAAGEVPPFRLETGRLGAFPNPRWIQVAWVGLGGDTDQLARLQQRLEANLARLGFSPDTRSFTPHLTLARLRNRVTPDERQKFGQLITGTGPKPPISLNVDTVSLMRSQLRREGAIYSRLSAARLKTALSTGRA